jgi:hypothetical protein
MPFLSSNIHVFMRRNVSASCAARFRATFIAGCGASMPLLPEDVIVGDLAPEKPGLFR